MRPPSIIPVLALFAALFHSRVSAQEAPQSLTVGVVQIALEATLAQNRDKIIRFVAEAKARGCRVVVFPETAIFWPEGTPKSEVDAAVEALRKSVDEADVYALVGGLYQRDGKEKTFERLLVIDPDGRIVQTYNKLWHDARFNDCPGLFTIDGVPCAAALCADRWIRGVEDLPAMAGAKILFECSNNYANEWLPELGHYWCVPRAMRNTAFIIFANTAKEDRGQLTPGHGHSAVIGPDGNLLTSTSEQSDTLLVATLDLSRATGEQARLRRNHPALKPFWDTGVAMLAGENRETPAFDSLVSPQVKLKIAAAQLACSRSIIDNVARMKEMIRAAALDRCDVVVFPELAITGALDEDILRAKQSELESAVDSLRQAVTDAKIAVNFGTPWNEGTQRFNCAIALGPDGTLLSRYSQLAVDRPKLFSTGTSTRSMWFTVKGVPCVMTVGRDALWSELAEMAAFRGAQVHLHLANDGDASDAAKLRRKQLWANIASFRTFTATVNAASTWDLKERGSASASGGSILWDDYHRSSTGKIGGYFPHSAVVLTEAKESETILYAEQTIPKTNPHFKNITDKTNRPLTPWYATGAVTIFSDGNDPSNSRQR